MQASRSGGAGGRGEGPDQQFDAGVRRAGGDAAGKIEPQVAGRKIGSGRPLQDRPGDPAVQGAARGGGVAQPPLQGELLQQERLRSRRYQTQLFQLSAESAVAPFRICFHTQFRPGDPHPAVCSAQVQVRHAQRRRDGEGIDPADQADGLSLGRGGGDGQSPGEMAQPVFKGQAAVEEPDPGGGPGHEQAALIIAELDPCDRFDGAGERGYPARELRFGPGAVEIGQGEQQDQDRNQRDADHAADFSRCLARNPGGRRFRGHGGLPMN